MPFLAPKQGSLLHFLQRTERGRYIYPLGANERYKAFYRGEKAMNNELMQNEDFIRCSTMIAELLMKYKAMETEISDRSGKEGQVLEEC